MSLPIRIVLIDTTHPGNIGAAARAMKNMGLRELHLVRPKSFPDADATSRASAADDVLQSARVHETLAAAVVDCGLVIGSTARQRHLPWPVVEPREIAGRVIAAAQAGPVAILFGSERFGLSNEEVAACNALVTIPTDAQYSSLNVAMAVQVIAYEIWLASRPEVPRPPPPEVPYATAEEMTRLYRHIEEVLALIEFRERHGGGHLMNRIRRLFNRANLDQNEMNILRGILTAIQARRRRAKRTVPEGS